MNHGSCIRASALLGRTVQSDAGERLGKVKDVVINLDSHHAPIVVVGYGGALGIGETLVAVPFHDLKWSPETQILALSTTKDKFQSAPETASGEWAEFSSQDWSKNINRYYGDPGAPLTSRFERQPATEPKNAETVREMIPSETQKGASQLENAAPNSASQPTDVEALLSQRVNQTIKQDASANADQIQTRIEKGVVTLTGTATSQSEKQRLEQDLKSLPGVDRVDDQLVIKE